MNLIKRTYKYLYFSYGELLLGIKNCPIPPGLSYKRNLFIYFDYEREFGGFTTSITDADIQKILSELKINNIKTTWFTVGKIFEKYPDSIQAILKDGHEIGSHTYSHQPPFRTSVKMIKEDFSSFERISDKFATIRGFHSPNGLWSLSMFKELINYGFQYDLMRKQGGKITFPYSVSIHKQRRIIRLQTIGDDWPLFVNRRNSSGVLKYLVDLTKKIQKGNIGGIGFHPWVLYADKNIFSGFMQFINYIKNNSDYEIQSACHFVNELKKELEKNNNN